MCRANLWENEARKSFSAMNAHFAATFLRGFRLSLGVLRPHPKYPWRTVCGVFSSKVRLNTPEMRLIQRCERKYWIGKTGSQFFDEAKANRSFLGRFYCYAGSVSRSFAALFLLWAFLLSVAGSASGAFLPLHQKNRVGGFESNPNIYTYEIGPQTLQPPWEDTTRGYDVASGVGDYVNQNPWSAFDPHGLEERSFWGKAYDLLKPVFDYVVGTAEAWDRAPEHVVRGDGGDLVNGVVAGAADRGAKLLGEGQEMMLGLPADTPGTGTALLLDLAAENRKRASGTEAGKDGAQLGDAGVLTGSFVGLEAKLAEKTTKTVGRATGRLVDKTSATTKVTSWADEGITPDLNPGRWVVEGKATKLNFFKTGLWGPKTSKKFPFVQKSKVPFKNSITDDVPSSSVVSPKTTSKEPGALIKKLWGQKKLKE